MSRYDDDRYKKAYEVVMEGAPMHTTMDRLTSFLYLLMRDHLPPGVVTEVVIDAHVGEGPTTLSNGYLALYAEHLAYKLKSDDTEQLLEELESEGVAIPSAFCERLRKKRKGEETDADAATEETNDGTGSKVEERGAGGDVREDVTPE